MDDFKALLEQQMKKATAAMASPKPAPEASALPTPPDEPDEPDDVPPQAQPASGSTRAPQAEPPGRATARAGRTTPKRPASNVNRVTVNLFEADRRALAVIKEYLSTAGHDFTSRSDSIKVALRLASKAKPEELARLYRQVKVEDRRFRAEP
jgi:hypothetical protein